MLKSTTFAILATCLLATPSLGADWTSGTSLGAQGVQGAFAINVQDGLFDLRFECSASKGTNRSVFMTLNTLPDAPLSLGNETTYPVIMSYIFSNGSTATSEILVDWAREDHGGNIWHSTFPMDDTFLEYFARSVKLELRTKYGSDDRLIFTYFMSGSAKAAKTFIEYCYSGNHS